MAEPFHYDSCIVFLYDGSDRDAGIGIRKLDLALIAFIELFAVFVVTDIDCICSFSLFCIIIFELDPMSYLAVSYYRYSEIDVEVTSGYPVALEYDRVVRKFLT